MSFSGEVKEEISRQINNARHCQLAELAAIVQFFGSFGRNDNGEMFFFIDTDNEAINRKYFTLLKKTFNIGTAKELYGESTKILLQALKILDADGVIQNISNPVNAMLIKNSCCKRAYLRGAYLCVGSMSDPKGSYHLEMVCSREIQAIKLCEIMESFGLEAKTIERKKYFVVYIKEGSGIVDFLNICEAHVSLMEMENARIVKEVRNSVNRRVNCEAANITKTVNAATKQVADIERLSKEYGLNNLPITLREIAEVRLEYPDATLSELGMHLNPPVGKSGVNHRLRRLSEIAQSL